MDIELDAVIVDAAGDMELAHLAVVGDIDRPEDRLRTAFTRKNADGASARGNRLSVRPHLHQLFIKKHVRGNCLVERLLFGGGELTLVATERVRTENNCTPRDVVSVDGELLFGFQVFIGLKTETRVQDVLSLFKFHESDGGYDCP